MRAEWSRLCTNPVESWDHTWPYIALSFSQKKHYNDTNVSNSVYVAHFIDSRFLRQLRNISKLIISNTKFQSVVNTKEVCLFCVLGFSLIGTEQTFKQQLIVFHLKKRIKQNNSWLMLKRWQLINNENLQRDTLCDMHTI